MRVRIPPLAPTININDMDTWSRNTAYAIGLITTDGNLSNDKRHISLTSTDKQILETFRKCLKLKNKISANPPGSYSINRCYKIQFSNVQFYNWLLTIGLKPNKTFNLSSLDIPSNYFCDFLRGHIDGDGSIIRYIDKHNSYKNKTYIYDRLYISIRSASFLHIKWIRKNVKKLLGIKGSLSGWKNKKTHNKKLWTLRYSKRDSLMLLKFLYYNPDVACSVRKKRVADNFLKNG